jgi:hypothetical protein
MSYVYRVTVEVEVIADDSEHALNVAADQRVGDYAMGRARYVPKIGDIVEAKRKNFVYPVIEGSGVRDNEDGFYQIIRFARFGDRETDYNYLNYPKIAELAHMRRNEDGNWLIKRWPPRRAWTTNLKPAVHQDFIDAYPEKVIAHLNLNP